MANPPPRISFRATLRAIRADLGRARHYVNRSSLAVILLFPGFQAVATYRLCRWLNQHSNARRFYWWPVIALQAIWVRFTEIITGAYISQKADIGPGLLIVHFGAIAIGEATVGRNCDIYQGVTLGYGGHDDKAGYPELGDRVFVAAGAKVIGKIKIGNDVAIGANAVVTRSVPDRAVVGGIPAKILSMQGSFGLVHYPGKENDAERAASLALREAVPAEDEG